MRRLRSLISAIVLTSLVGVCLAGAIEVWRHRLPEPETADTRGLVRWLVQRDLAAEPRDVRARLVRRVELELRQGIEMGEVNRRLTADQRRRFWRNVELLAWDWFTDKVETYSRLPPGEATAWLDRQLDQIRSWRLQELFTVPRSQLVSREDVRGAGAADDMHSVLSQLQHRIQRSEPHQQAKIRQFVLAVQTRLLFRGFRGAMTGEG